MRTLATLLFAAATAAFPAAQAQEPPSRVGRVAHIEGQASLYQDPEAGWEKAYVNSPITSENSVWTDGRSRAELRVSGMALRVDELTQLDIAKLDDDELDAFIGRGSVAVRVRHHESKERLVFRTPNASVRLRADGRYRIDVDHEREETRVTVFAGEASIGTDEGRMRLAAGRSALIFGIDRPEFVEERAKSDDFDRWTAARDERWREGQTPTYVSTHMTGYEDLSAYGQWAQEPEYGALWYPSRVASTWAPYRYGHWTNVRPWGWTWVDDAPWGYAPFHYGRWVYVRNRWAWSPGERVVRPVWAPALVAWVGGANFTVGVSGAPSVGWYPLSPWDRYDPWFNASPTYVNRLNVVVRRDQPTREDRRNWHAWTRERGTTVVDRGALMDRRPIAQAAIPITVDAIRRAPVSRQPETMLPSRNDYIARRRQQPQPAVPAPTVAQQRAQPGAPVSQQPPGRSAVAQPDFSRRATVAPPQPASAPPGRRPEAAQQPASVPSAQRPGTAQPPVSREERERAVRQQTDQAIRDAQQQGQAQERAQREAAQAQERAQREATQQQQQQRQAQERAQREAQQAQEKAQRETAQQQQQQRQAQERAQREAQQAQEKAQRETAQQQQQQQQQRQAQERAQREAQQAQEKAQRETAQQQQQQRQAQERAQREAQQAQERAQREAAQQQQRPPQQSREEKERAVRQQTDQAIKDAQKQGQAQERAQREAQQQAQQQQQAQERAAREAAARQQREKDKEKEKEEKESRGKGSKP